MRQSCRPWDVAQAWKTTQSFCVSINYWLWRRRYSIYHFKVSCTHWANQSLTEQSHIYFPLSSNWPKCIFSQTFISSKRRKECEKRKISPGNNSQWLQNSSAGRRAWFSRKMDMIIALPSTGTCLQQCKNKVMAENKSIILVNVELVNKPKQALHGTLPARHERIATAVPVHLFRFAIRIDTNLSSWVER